MAVLILGLVKVCAGCICNEIFFKCLVYVHVYFLLITMQNKGFEISDVVLYFVCLMSVTALFAPCFL